MKKYITHYSIAITLFFASIASAMDPKFFANLNPEFVDRLIGASGDLPILTCLRPSTRDLATLQAAKIHNANILLIAIDKNISPFSICNQFVDKSDSLQKNITNILALGSTCTHFNDRLKYFGQMLRMYDNDTKDAALKELLQETLSRYYIPENFSYEYLRRKGAFSLLVYAGAQHNTNKAYFSLLECAMLQKDVEMINTLFQYGADANLESTKSPVFWRAKTKKMAQLFIDHGANLNHFIRDISLLSYCLIDPAYKPELFQFYIDKGANPRMLDCGQRSPLHWIFNCSYKYNKTTVEKIKILLNVIGDMINVADKAEKTPLDLLIESVPPAHPIIIALLKDHGAKTSEELKRIEPEKKKEDIPMVIQPSNPASCFVCFEGFGNPDEQIKIPCKNNHSDDIHVACYNEVLKKYSACPICRAELQ